MRKAPAFMRAGKKVIDMSADYRLKDTTAYERFYKTPHADSENLPRAVYGLPEVNRDAVKAASLVANPGCYPTGSILALFPGLAKGLFEPRSVIIDAKSGATGAGRKAVGLGFSDINESLKAYKVFEHQHVPEINQELSNAGAGRISVTFVPHLIPMNRGLLTTAYVKLAKSVSQTELIEAYRAFYTGEKFVKVYADGKLPETKHVVRTNFCDIGLKVDSEKGIAVIVSAIDNLGKGAAWQAVQNMNIMCGFSETEGIWQ
jgi:N-acetyl-gamma-glutamyl-phosphate reductase